MDELDAKIDELEKERDLLIAQYEAMEEKENE